MVVVLAAADCGKSPSVDLFMLLPFPDQSRMAGRVAVTVALVVASASASERRVRWYVNSDVSANVKFAQDHPDAITGFYGCCGLAGIDADGNASASNWTHLTGPMKAALAPNRSLTFHAVFGIAEDAIRTGQAHRAIPELVRAARAGGADGLLADYEPSTKNQTTAHAEAYADFMDALAKELHEVDLELGMDVGGETVLMDWAYFAKTEIDFFSSMSPTYDDEPGARSWFTKGMAKALGNRTAVGVGSMVDPENKGSCHLNFGWNATKFRSFTDFIQGPDVRATTLDVWRCDIDTYGETEPWFVDEVAAFLNPKE